MSKTNHSSRSNPSLCSCRRKTSRPKGSRDRRLRNKGRARRSSDMITQLHRLGIASMLVGLLCSCAAPSGAGSSGASGTDAHPVVHSKLVYPGPDGKLRYAADENGNTIPDFSNCGYHGGGVRIPDVATKVTVEPEANSKDDTARIQRAIDEVAKLPRDEHGFRGAVLI